MNGFHCILLFRFIERYVLPEALPMLSPHMLFRLLAEPLRTLLCGQFFTAVLAQSPTAPVAHPLQQGGCYHNIQRVNPNHKYMATKFNLLRERPRCTVYSILCNELSETNNSEDLLLPDLVSDKTKHYQSEEGNKISMSCTSSSIFSCVSSPGSQQSRKITFESHTQSVVDGSKTNLSYDGCPGHNQASSYSFCAKALKNSCTQNSCSRLSGSSVNSTKIDSFYSSTPNNMITGPVSLTAACKCIGDEWCDGWTDEDHMSLCEDILGELMSTWEESRLQKKRNSLNGSSSSQAESEYTETMPDSESFLDEFQCDFEPTPTTSSVACTQQQGDSTPSSLSTTHKQHSRLSKHNSSLVTSRLTQRKTMSDKHRPCLEANVHSQQFTPELFSSTQESVMVPDTTCVSDSNIPNLSPELFSSPLIKVTPAMAVSTAVLVSDELCSDGCTPAVGHHMKSIPKRKLLHPLQNSLDLHTSHEDKHKAIVNENDVTDTISFSPELFP